MPCHYCLPRQPSNPEHKWLSAHVRAGCPPLSEGGGWRAPSLWTVPPSFTFQAGGLPLLGCSSCSSPPAWLLMLFLLLLPLSWESMDSGLSPEAEVCVHLSLPHPFPLPLHLCSSHALTCKNSVPVLEMEEPNQQAALSQEWEGRENYLLLSPRGADRCCCCVLALLRQCGALGCEESSTEACNTSLFYFSV